MKKTGKKLLALILCVAMVFSLCVIGAGAEGATELPTVDNGVITLEADTTTLATKWTIAAGETVTLNLNGKTLDVAANGILVKGTLVIKDTSTESTGTLQGSANVITVSGGAVTVTGGTIKTTSTYSFRYGISTSGNTSITVGEKNGDDNSVNINSIRGDAENKLTIHSGIIGRIGGVINADDVLNGLFESDLNSVLPSGKICKQDGEYYKVVDLTDEADAEAKIGDALYASAVRAAKDLKDGETLVLLKDVTGSIYAGILVVEARDAVIDLNGHDVTNTYEDAQSVISIKNPNRSPNTTCTATVKNTGSQQATLTGSIPLLFSTGDSRYGITATLEGDIALESTGDQKIKLNSSALLAYTEDAANAVANGGYKAVDSDDNAYIYGSFASAVDKDADKVIEMLNDYTGSDSIMLSDGTATLDMQNHSYAYTGIGETAAAIRMTKNNTSAAMTIKNGTITSAADGASVLFDNNTLILDNVKLTAEVGYGIVSNGTNAGNNVTLQNGSVLTVKDGAGIYWPSKSGKVTINNSTVIGKTGVQVCAGELKITGENTVITATGAPEEKTEEDGVIFDGAAVSVVKRDGYGDITNVTIENGKFISADGAPAVKACQFNNADKTETEWAEAKTILKISGGTFSTDPSAYVAKNEAGKATHMVVADGKMFKVELLKETAAEVAAAPAKVEVPDTIDKDVAEDIKTAIEAVKPVGLEAAAGEIANNNTITEDTAKAELEKEISVDSSATVTVYVQPYMEITITDAKTTTLSTSPSPSPVIESLTLDIKPMVKTVVSTASEAKDIKLENSSGQTDKNAVVIGEPEPLKVETPVTISFPLPTGFISGDKLQVKHDKGDGRVFYYDATVTTDASDTRTATFTVTNGFSEFTLTAADTRKVNVTFDQTGVDAKEYSITDVGTALPTVTKAGYTFTGWTFSGLTGVYKTLPDFWAGTTGDTIADVTATAQFSLNYVPGGSAPSKEEEVKLPFTDVADGAWYADAVKYVYSNELFSGVSATQFAPGTTMTRGMLMSVLSRMDGVAASPDTWLESAVSWAVSKGVSDGTNPNGDINREQLVSMLYRYAGSPDVGGMVLAEFPDGASVSSWAYSAMIWAVQNGIITGTGAGTLNPQGAASRAEVAVIIMNFCEMGK